MMLKKNFFFFFLLIQSLLLFFYFGLGGYGLLNNNEGLYAQIPWEMITSGNWIIPHLNGVPYIEKPPLLYWLIAGSFKVFGKTEFAARFVPATFGFLSCCSLYFFARSFGSERWGRLSALILSSFMGFAIFSRMVFFDVALTFFLTVSALSFYKFYQTREKKYLYGLSVFMAAAVLTKGFVALVLMGIVILSFTGLERSFSFLKLLFNPLAIGIFLILTVPWHLLASLQDPGFSWFYFINEHWMRFLDKRIPKDYYTGPFYYYVPRVIGYIVPWIFLMPFFVRKKRANLETSMQRFLWCWFIGFFVFFSLSKAKANYYMVVGLPPLALWLGAHLSKANWKNFITGVALLSSAIMIVGGVVYVRQKEDKFSVKRSIGFLDLKESIYLYKRFEELSTLPFYVEREIPILDCESKDLWYGQRVGKRPDLFLSSRDTFLNQRSIYVLKRDERDFLMKYKEFSKKILYEAPGYFVFLVSKK
jgi:4-amino-4-deoxy-L-arabinose transferase-like glycosyltransferase